MMRCVIRTLQQHAPNAHSSKEVAAETEEGKHQRFTKTARSQSRADRQEEERAMISDTLSDAVAEIDRYSSDPASVMKGDPHSHSCFAEFHECDEDGARRLTHRSQV